MEGNIMPLRIPNILTIPPRIICQRLQPVNHSYSIEEGVQCRIKDPTWMMGIQRLAGEFRAENGGMPVKINIKTRNRKINTIKLNSDQNYFEFDINTPLEMVVEPEEADGSPSKSWNSCRLEYSFKIKGEGDDVKLEADEYDGNNLDWYSFTLNLEDHAELTEPEEDFIGLPTHISYRGMTASRWWSLENYKTEIGNINRSYLNYLTMLLLEFTLLYSNDWYYVPLEQEVGTIRQITSFTITDSFGEVTKVEPVVDPTTNKTGWEAFTLTPSGNKRLDFSSEEEEAEISNGSFFYLPNNLPEGALEGSPIEEVSFIRDELANLVWAIEHKYKDPDDGTIKNRHDEEPSSNENLMDTPVYYYDTQAVERSAALVERSVFADTADSEPGNRYIGPLPKYRLMSYVPPHWIPYIAQQIRYPRNITGELEGQIFLRRGRTQKDTTEAQYRGKLLRESKYLYEEEVPRVGIRVSRIWQLARDCQGKICTGITRKKRPDKRLKSSGLRFDYLQKKR